MDSLQYLEWWLYRGEFEVPVSLCILPSLFSILDTNSKDLFS